ncbi:methyl-accepting chemotaxis protein [Salinibius halmophilus]|uniref:methyl-accepting chemotaxis protein n=1 Tax=Salinibius halmophilus TaxID=1853216 RepID=UPI000E663B8C|nr:methyl-accepting chemotaxis protein [Salinibius halmophilus]
MINPLSWYFTLFKPAKRPSSDLASENTNIVLLYTFFGYLVWLYSWMKWQSFDVPALVLTSWLVLAASLATSLLIKFGANIALAMHVMFLGVTAHSLNMVYQTGGLDSQHILWVVVNIVLVFLVAGRLSSLLWAAVNGLALIFFMVLAFSDSHQAPNVTLTADELRTDTISGYLLPLILVTIVQLFGHRLRTNSTNKASMALAQAETTAKSLAVSMEQSQTMLHVAKSNIDVLVQATNDLQAVQHRVRENIQHMTQQSAELASSSSFFNKRLQEIEQSLQLGQTMVSELSAQSTQAQDLTVLSASAMGEVVAAMQSIKDNNDAIGEAIGVINSLAQQTNLLALNAAIEAARAGESGRGFAVVADEVRTLSGRSNASADEIREILSRSIAGVEQGVHVVDSAKQRLAEVEETVESINQKMQGISTQISAQNQDVLEITKYSATLASISTDQNAAAESLRESQNQLENILNQIRELSQNMVDVVQA